MRPNYKGLKGEVSETRQAGNAYESVRAVLNKAKQDGFQHANLRLSSLEEKEIPKMLAITCLSQKQMQYWHTEYLGERKNSNFLQYNYLL